MRMLNRIRKHVHLPIFSLSLVVIGFISWGISKDTGYRFWAVLVGLYVALAVIGLIIASDKDDE